VVARTRPSRSMEKSSLTGTRKRSIHRKDALIEDRKEASGFGGSVGLVGTVVDLSFCLIVRVRGKSTSLHKKLPSFLIVTWQSGLAVHDFSIGHQRMKMVHKLEIGKVKYQAKDSRPLDTFSHVP